MNYFECFWLKTNPYISFNISCLVQQICFRPCDYYHLNYDDNNGIVKMMMAMRITTESVEI